ncbi:MAG TPA: glycerol-3-phosphate 1-O-acyltransferase PlsY [Vineibacter sp.]|nr:glycerol-3-phosphate 1-O-acyltransferase PlsY [Vineibacter sp.]
MPASPYAIAAIWPWLLAALAFGYLLGSIPFGLIFTRLAGAGDIRQVGSGNIGATNVLRTGRKGIAAATLLADAGKGAVAVLAAGAFAGEPASLAAGLGAVLGHCFPLWLKFKGGKGVATTLGCLLAWSWPLGIAACLLWLLLAVLFRISSLSALLGLALTAVLAWLFGVAPPWGYAVSSIPMAIVVTLTIALVWAMHHENIARLLAGTEPKIGRSKKA